MAERRPLVLVSGNTVEMGPEDKVLSELLPEGAFGNLDGGFSDSTYGGISPIDCGGSV